MRDKQYAITVSSPLICLISRFYNIKLHSHIFISILHIRNKSEGIVIKNNDSWNWRSKMLFKSHRSLYLFKIFFKYQKPTFVVLSGATTYILACVLLSHTIILAKVFGSENVFKMPNMFYWQFWQPGNTANIPPFYTISTEMNARWIK